MRRDPAVEIAVAAVTELPEQREAAAPRTFAHGQRGRRQPDPPNAVMDMDPDIERAGEGGRRRWRRRCLRDGDEDQEFEHAVRSGQGCRDRHFAGRRSYGDPLCEGVAHNECRRACQRNDAGGDGLIGARHRVGIVFEVNELIELWPDEVGDEMDVDPCPRGPEHVLDRHLAAPRLL